MDATAKLRERFVRRYGRLSSRGGRPSPPPTGMRTGDGAGRSPGRGRSARAGCVAVLTLWTKNLVWSGITKGLGIMLLTLKVQLASQAWLIGWILSMTVAVGGVVAPLAGFLGRRLGTRYVIMACGVMMGVACIAGSCVNDALQLGLVYVLLAGTGSGIANVLAKEAVALSFDTNYATANGIARTGYSVGLFVFAPLVQFFMDTYGWRGTLLLMGAISMHLVVSGALMANSYRPAEAPESRDYGSVPQGDLEEAPAAADAKPGRPSWWRLTREGVSQSLDVRLFRSGPYWLVSTISCCNTYAYSMWIIYFVSQAESVGFSAQDAGTFVTVAGVGNLISKVLQGFVTDKGLLSSWALMAVSMAVGAVAYCATPWLTSYWAMMASAVMILVGDGVITCQTDVLTKEVIDADLLAGTFGWISLKGALLVFSAGFIPGWLYDTTGSGVMTFMIIGCLQAATLIPLFILKHKYLK